MRRSRTAVTFPTVFGGPDLGAEPTLTGPVPAAAGTAQPQAGQAPVVPFGSAPSPLTLGSRLVEDLAHHDGSRP